jgi:hypothetical protein
MTRPGPPHATSTDLLVLHALRCTGFAGLGRVAAATGLPEPDAESELTDLAAAYDGFLVLNPELLDLCTAWQTRSVDGVVTMNDHSDPGYDARVLDRPTDLDRRAEAVCADLSAAMLRFRRYRVRLAGALARARSGALDYVTDSTASYHTVWFQLHEDLLPTLGIPRR